MLENEAFIRLASFLGLAIGFGAMEALFPRREQISDRLHRWLGNLGLVAVSAGLVRLLFPVLPVTLAVVAEKQNWGLLSIVHAPYPLALLTSILVLDLAIYFQHWAFHVWRPLWMLHRVHHADTAFDFTTGNRFHPLEIMLSMIFKLALVLLLGPPAFAVLLFEVMLNGLSMFNHANIAIPVGMDKYLRLLVVTPDMHRVHHSTDRREANHNFGFNLPWWDRIFATYKAQPRLGHETMPIGLTIFRERKYGSLPRLLALPFIKPGK
ncbi:sterol desaturase family protein [Desulfocurvibacter africanus]|uniref:Fatty acid hydroxylase n=1 Tax=Desulfocurvibacter africanus subsp. africanus str. Walvis Bay TaxID=690850 RepID=F3YTR0_DESAF|nr:sterol desaturase family protein [Desulfocurvibacter africanus]EGJ48441.1 fatty acid hydroxylase [Desulfocurvibacter africanus subsp. africanus str. Walvis Bay]